MKTALAKSSWLYDRDLRLDASFHLSSGRQAKIAIQELSLEKQDLSKLSLKIYNGARFKRVYIADEKKGIAFMGSSDMLKTDFTGLKFLSKVYTKNISELLIKKDWILVSCSGTIGNTIYTSLDFEGKAASQHIMRIIPDTAKIKSGYLYAFLSSKYGYSLLTQGTYGAVIQHIEPEHIENIPVPIFPEGKQQQIHDLIIESAKLREESNALLKAADEKLHLTANLAYLKPNDFNYFGARSIRKASYFIKSINNIDSTTINAFNHSFLIEKLVDRVKQNNYTFPLLKVLDEKQIFSTGSFPRIEVKSNNGIMLINQSDIFDTIIQGKKISKRKVKTDNLAQYGEVMIAGVGTLGESESFCRVVFANEDIQGQLVSGEFIRMKTNSEIPSGYLYTWLNTDYGFRLIRSTQSGTKLCRPIPRLLLKLPVPILDESIMLEIHNMVTKAHTLRYQANQKELQAIQLVENEIEQWQH